MLQWFICSVSIEWNVRATLVNWTCFGSRTIKLMPSWDIVYIGFWSIFAHKILCLQKEVHNLTIIFYWQDRMIGQSDFI
jgi:hypothetical protein